MTGVLVSLIFCPLFFCSILVEDYGVVQLQLIPMLVGFFTYKVATFVQAIEEALTVVKEPQA